MKKRIPLVKQIFGLIMGLFIFISCQQNEGILPEDPTLEFQRDGSPMILGKQVENPYSVENMNRALENLTAQGRMDGDITIETTDVYVRFLPADSLQLQALESDSTLELFDFPLDFEIEEVGHWYHDSSIPDHLPTYQYTVVKPDYIFPDTIQHEVLADLFLVDELIENAEFGRTNLDINFLRELEDEALRITNNWEDRIDLSKARWNPRGRVRERIFPSTSGGWLPVQRVRVRARRWFTIKTDYTDSEGYYKINSFTNRPVNYSIVWQTSYMKVTNWLGLETRHNGPKKESSWNPDFGWYSEGWVRATVLNAAVEYNRQRKRTGIENPYPEGIWSVVNSKLNIRTVFDEGTGNHWRIRTNRIKIFSKRNGGQKKTTDELYALTFHEIGHQSHWKLNRWNITFSKRILRESWSEFIKYYFTREYYSNFYDVRITSLSSIPNRDKSAIKSTTKSAYTQIFVDLMDDHNQLAIHGGDRADDNVSGYTFGQIQSAVKQARKLEDVRDYLRDTYNNGTEDNLNELFNFYLQFQP